MDSGQHKKILMVDDEQFLLDMFKLSFEKHGFEVVNFHDVDQALQFLRNGALPDAVTFDISMPNSKSGFEFIEAVSKEKLAPHALKVAFTNASEAGVQERVSELGADAYLVKTQYVPSELAEKVSELLLSRQPA